MTTLVLTLAGADRTGLVEAVARAVSDSGGNWERSELAELSGVFAGVVQVTVPDARAAELRAALGSLDGLLEIAAHAEAERPADTRQDLTVSVLGNDRPGIVREVSAALRSLGVSVDRMTTETRDAAMAGGRLFEAQILAQAPGDADPARIRRELERIAAELQVDIAIG